LSQPASQPASDPSQIARSKEIPNLSSTWLG
jgi:hypothetical protein